MKLIDKEIYVCRTMIRNLQAIFACPKYGHSCDFKLCIRFLSSRLLLGGPFFVGIFGSMYQSLMNGHIFEIMSGLYVINVILMYSSANLIAFMRGDHVIIYLESLSRMRKENLKDYEKVVQKTETLTKTIFYSNILVLSATAIESYALGNFCNGKEYFYDMQYMCGALAPMWFPMTKYYAFLQPICAVYAFLFVAMQCPAMLSSATLYFCSVEFIMLKMDKLTESLKKIDFLGQSTKKIEKDFKQCVEYYIEINRLVGEMNDSVGYLFAPTHNAYNNVLMGILGYLSIKLRSLSNGLELIVWIVVQWLSCYSGQKLENASELLQKEVYNLSWYEMHPSLRRTFINFQGHVSLTFHMKIQPIIYMNMNSFSSILKGSYSFLMYLLKM